MEARPFFDRSSDPARHRRRPGSEANGCGLLETRAYRHPEDQADRHHPPRSRPSRMVPETEGLPNQDQCRAADVHGCQLPKNTGRNACATNASRHNTSRSSPSRRVTCSRSRNSSSGMAYLREIPVHSLKAPTLNRSALRAASSLRSFSMAAR